MCITDSVRVTFRLDYWWLIAVHIVSLILWTASVCLIIGSYTAPDQIVNDYLQYGPSRLLQLLPAK